MTTVTIDERLVWRETEDGIVIVDPDGGKVRVLNGVGSDIWKMIADKLTLEEVAAQIVVEYEVEESQALIDAKAFLDGLATEGIVTLSE